MGSAYRMLTELGHQGGESLDGWFGQLPPEHPARLAYGTAALSESRTRSSIYTGTAAHLRLWGEPGIAWMCAGSDHDPAEAGKRPMAIFLLMPDEAGARRYIASLYINQAYSSLAHVARECGGKLPVPVWFLLDEVGNIGRLPGITEKLTVAAGRNIRFVLAIQAIAQLAHVYGDKAAEIILGNCDTWLYLRTADVDTARAISAKAGTYTVRTLSMQRRGNFMGGGTESAAGRALLTPDEVLRWPSGQALLLQAGQFPVRLPLVDLSSWPAASRACQVKKDDEKATPKAGLVPTWIPGEAVTTVKKKTHERNRKHEMEIFERR
jgi:type IV secretion system protein VirD4